KSVKEPLPMFAKSTVTAVLPTSLLALLVAVFPAVSATGQQSKAKPVTKEKRAEEESKKPRLVVAQLTLKGAVSEMSASEGLFASGDNSLLGLIDRLNQAAKDEKLSGMVLKIRGTAMGRAQAEDVRLAIGRARAAGRKIYADIHDAGTQDYLLASACDHIIMPESGTLMIPGLRAEITYYKTLFDFFGIKADMMQVGSYKGTAEPYTRSSMSPEFRQQYEQLLGDFYDQLIETIATDRKLPVEKVRGLIDQGLFTAQQALQAGLIDEIAYGDQIKERLGKDLATDVGQIDLLNGYAVKKVENDFSGMLGMVKLFDRLLSGADGKKTSQQKKIAVVYAVGTIVTGESTFSLLGGTAVGSDTLVQALKQADSDKTVQAIVLRVDSPGGSALASDLIWREVQRIKKPVIASMGNIAASGGYYISMGCDQIYAQPGTLTGSIGVVGGKISFAGLFERFGVKTEVISIGKNSGLLSAVNPMTESERKVWKANMEEVYRQFVAKTASGRNLTVKQLEPLAGGRVWTGRQAKKNGLVDHLGTLHEAIQAAKKAANFKDGEKAELLVLPESQSFLDQLLGGGGSPFPGFQSHIPKSWLQNLQDVEAVRKLFAEPALMLMPYRVIIR
ncbi:MAG: signal peptide peptidase SppA, partial [Pirellulaceae bacterium]